jgi:hypothetical protein
MGMVTLRSVEQPGCRWEAGNKPRVGRRGGDEEVVVVVA